MRILMLGWELPPHNSGGLGVACYQLCKALAAKGADIEFIVPYSAKHDVDFMKVTAAHPQGIEAIVKTGTAYDSYKYVYADGREEEIGIFGQQELYERAVSQLVSERQTSDPQVFDVIHAHDWLTFRAALRLKQQTNMPLVVHLHSTERDRAGGTEGNLLVREIESMGLMMADRIITVSQHTKDMVVRDYKIPPEKISVIHNSIDKEALAPLDPQNAYHYLSALKAQGYRVVSNVGRLTIQKNLVNLLYAAKEVIRRVPKTIFLLVGSGDQYFELIALAAELGIAKNVVFAGFQRGKNWRDSYAIADLFVMPSISEPFGLTALEAVGYGAPILISKQSGVAEVIRNSLKVDFWDVKELANKIVAVVQNDVLRDELHSNAYSEYDHLNWDASARSVWQLYEKHAQGTAA